MQDFKWMVCAKFNISIMKYTVFVNGLNNYSTWLLDAILDLVDLDKFTQTDELIMVFECICQISFLIN